MIPPFDMQKTTPCGRFTVTIISNTPLTELSTVQDHARSLKNLADLMSEGATFALEAAVRLLGSKAQHADSKSVVALASRPQEQKP